MSGYKIEQVKTGPSKTIFRVYRWRDAARLSFFRWLPAAWAHVLDFDEEHKAREFVEREAFYPVVVRQWTFDKYGREEVAY